MPTPATSIDATSRQGGSFIGACRFFLSGSARNTTLVLAAVALPMAIIFPFPESRRMFVSFASMAGFGLASATWSLETYRADRLAFMSLLPQPVPGRWLVLAPMCALALLATVAMAICGLRPAPALAFLGCCLWIIAGVRWLTCARSWWWSVLPIPLLALAPLVAFRVHRLASWSAAAAVSLVLGLAALAFQPRVRFGGSNLAGVRPRRSLPAPRATVTTQAVSIPGGGRGAWRAQVWLLLSLHWSLWLLVGMWFFLGTSSTLLYGCAGNMAWMLVLMVPSEITQAIYSRDTHEFLRPRPVTNGQIVVAGLVIPLLIALSLPALALALVDRDWINRGGLFFKPPFASTLEYLRVVLGATFLPEKWPPGGLTVEMWQKLRPLLYMDVLRMTCLILASLFSKAGVNRGASKNRGPVSSVNMALMIITFVCGMRLSLPGGGGSFFGSLPMPSVWFAALLAVVTIVSWDRHRRALIAPR